VQVKRQVYQNKTRSSAKQSLLSTFMTLVSFHVSSLRFYLKTGWSSCPHPLAPSLLPWVAVLVVLATLEPKQHPYCVE